MTQTWKDWFQWKSKSKQAHRILANIIHVTCQTQAEIIEEKTNHFDYKRNEFFKTGKEEQKSSGTLEECG